MLFVDFGVDQQSSPVEIALFLSLCGLTLGMVGWALVYLGRRGSHLAKLLLLPMIFLPTLGLLGTDLLMQANRSEFNRYSLPSYLGIQIVVAYFLAAKLQLVDTDGAQPPPHKGWKFALASVLAMGLLSGTLFSISPSWWNKGDVRTPFRAYQCVTTAMNQSGRPRLVSDAFFVHVLALSHSLKDETEIQLLNPEAASNRALIANLTQLTDVRSAPTGLDRTGLDRTVFMYLPSPDLQQQVQAQYNLQAVCPNLLWQIGSPK
jgi:uncharacterized membrane protein